MMSDPYLDYLRRLTDALHGRAYTHRGRPGVLCRGRDRHGRPRIVHDPGDGSELDDLTDRATALGIYVLGEEDMFGRLDHPTSEQPRGDGR